MPLINRRSFIFTGIASALVEHRDYASDLTKFQTAITRTLDNSRAIAVVIDRRTGKHIAEVGDIRIANTPGSLLKPLVLFGALKQGIVSTTTSVFCRRDLHIGNTAYPCTHPQSNISFNAQEALAYSCNTWFAALALRMRGHLQETLINFQLRPSAGPNSSTDDQLFTLGLRGIATSPLDIARAYGILAQQLAQSFSKPIADGLRDSVSFGMSHNADVPGIIISGKTGTANRPPKELWSHGWFAGFVTLREVSLVISVYLPQGNGADAALLARNAIQACSKERP